MIFHLIESRSAVPVSLPRISTSSTFYCGAANDEFLFLCFILFMLPLLLLIVFFLILQVKRHFEIDDE